VKSDSNGSTDGLTVVVGFAIKDLKNIYVTKKLIKN
jgi:hypothetical protein